MVSMEFLIKYAFMFIGTPYVYGGNLPFFVDCSGYANELAKYAGILENNKDLTSQQLFDHFMTRGGSLETEAVKGAFVFYGDSVTKITHVGFAVDEFSMLSAAGGDERIMSVDEAKKRGAFVKGRPINYRKDLVAVVFPAYRF